MKIKFTVKQLIIGTGLFTGGIIVGEKILKKKVIKLLQSEEFKETISEKMMEVIGKEKLEKMAEIFRNEVD